MFDRVTIVNVDGRAGELHETQLALHYSAMQMPGARCLLLSPTKPKQLLSPIEHIAIAPMGHLEYSLFVTYALHEFIETDYALIVQNDGWVLNGASFSKDFLEFDYIGAPCHIADVITNSAHSYIKRFLWVAQEARHELGVKINYTMNGGFSLRSKKFLKTPSLLGLDYRLRPPQAQRSRQGEYQMKWPNGEAAEDVYHCIINRAAMDDAGIRFAPLCAAVKFAFEHLNPILHGQMDVSKVFGHHAVFRRLASLDPLTIQCIWPEHEVRSVMMEPEVIAIFEKLGYKVKFTA
ncbi:MAG: hypothetical protein LBP94_06640 [Zoogloeaceae bacterium]|jgi:hypothetical protein|nr:hypothetical protein [Zoogloeaceae bacterium]